MNWQMTICNQSGVNQQIEPRTVITTKPKNVEELLQILSFAEKVVSHTPFSDSINMHWLVIVYENEYIHNIGPSSIISTRSDYVEILSQILCDAKKMLSNFVI